MVPVLCDFLVVCMLKSIGASLDSREGGIQERRNWFIQYILSLHKREVIKLFQKLFSRFHMIITRFSIYSLLKSKGTKLKESNTNANIGVIMKQYEDNLVSYNNLNEDLSRGQITAQSKNGQRLVAAFDANHDEKNEENFYFQVAEHWIKDFEKKLNQLSLLFIFLFVI
jgi:hypothetical protein